MIRLPRMLPCVPATLAALSLAIPASAPADGLVRARVVVDASNPSAVKVRQELQWNAEGGTPRTELAFHLAPGVEVTGAQSEGSALRFRGETAPGGDTKRWVVSLAVPLAPGASRPIVLETSVPADGTPGMYCGAKGGYLLPGSGWFASLGPDVLEIPPHTTEFVLPQGWDGIAGGTRAAGDAKWTALPGRPYAVWGPYRAVDASAGKQTFTVWRREGSGEPPRLARIAEVIEAVAIAVGEAPGSGPWKLIDVGRGVAAGGQRTLLWDERKVAAARGDDGIGVDRDLASAIGVAHWQEALRFAGAQSAFLGGGLSRYLGDAALVALEDANDPWRTDARIVGPRRTAFVAALAEDRPLANLSPFAAEAARVLDTRGALVAHMFAEACPTRPLWLRFLHAQRRDRQGGTLTMKEFLPALDDRFRNQHRFLDPYLAGTDLPDFVLAGHAPSDFGTGDRVKIDVANHGKAGGWAEVTTFTADDRKLRSTRLLVGPGETRSVLMGDASRTVRIRIEPRGTALQSALGNEEATLVPASGATSEAHVPAFPFAPAGSGLRKVENLTIVLDGVEIRDFSGLLQAWETHHGPSGAVLLGKATVVVHPGGPFAEDFRARMGRDAITFAAEDLFLRFPVGAWERIEPALGATEAEPVPAAVAGRRQFVFEHSYPACFAEGSLAQVPPPGGALAVFGLGGEEWRGYSREPLPNGKVVVRLWDHLRGTPIWEATL